MTRVNNNNGDSPLRGFLTPPPTWKSRPRHSPAIPMSERKWSSSPMNKVDSFHVVHKVPAGDSPYVKAKQVQLIEKDPSRAISLFWAAINAGDRVDSALKDMAIVMKQLNRSDEAIEAIKSFRHLCPYDAQGSLDNVLLELYKRSGRIEEEIEMLQRKLKTIEEGTVFCGKRTKIARSQGKKIQITVDQEKSRILGNLAWAYLQLNNYTAAEELYRKALSLEPDKNKQCNLAICLMHTNRITEAKSLLQAVKASSRVKALDESCARSLERALQILTDLESGLGQPTENVESQEENPGKKSTPTPMCSPQATFVDRWRKGSYSKNPSDRSVCSAKENRGNPAVGLNVSSACKNAVSSPSAGRNEKAPIVEPRRCLWGFNDGDWRRDIWEKNAVGSSCLKLSLDQHVAYENVQALAIQELNEESLMSVDGTQTSETILYEGRSQNPSATVSGNNRLAENPQPVHDCWTGRSKKSWADMVEEEESSYGRTDFLDDLLQESSFSFQAGWENEKQFNDENLDSNINQPRGQGEVLSKKEMELEDGYYASGDIVSSRNLIEQRLSDLNLLEKPESPDRRSSSSFAKRALNFKDHTPMVSNEKRSEPWKSINHRSSNRLQVFQDITGTI